jgi:flagellar biosynthesis/type III secretory pathway chaperone
MDANACRAQFARLLSDEAALLGSLEEQLRHEHELLVGNDVEGLESASGARQDTVAKLLRIDDERRGLARLLGHHPDTVGLAALLTWCDPQGSLAAAQGECAQRAQLCREQNERNGVLVTARLNRITGMLDMLADNTNTKTYAPHSGSRNSAPTGRMVSLSA